MTCKRLHKLVTPLVYSSLAITFSSSNDFIDWAASYTDGARVHLTTLDWDAPALYTSFAYISVPFHRLPSLHAAFASNPTLATFTSSLVLNPFSGKVTLVNGWEKLAERGWTELRSILPFFTNLQRVAVHGTLPFPPELLLGLPALAQLIHLEILHVESTDSALRLLQSCPNLEIIKIIISKGLSNNSSGGVVALNFPRLVSLEAGPTVWAWVTGGLSPVSWSSLKHHYLYEFNDLSDPIPPISTLNNLISLELAPDDQSLIHQVGLHLHRLEYLSIMTSMSDVPVDLSDLLSIPSQRLKYIHLELYHPRPAFSLQPETPIAFFDRFPALAIFDVDNIFDEGFNDCSVTRFLRNNPSPVTFAPVPTEPLKSWWERAIKDVEDSARIIGIETVRNRDEADSGLPKVLLVQKPLTQAVPRTLGARTTG